MRSLLSADKPNTMRKTLLIVTLSILVQNLFSQSDSLLKTFKYRIDNYRAINFSVGGNSQFQKSELVSNISKNSSSGGGLGASYYTVKNTDKILLTTEGSLYSSFSTGKAEDTVIRNKSRNFSAAPQFSILNKWFYKKNIFAELGADLSAALYTNKNVLSNFPDPSKDRQANYAIAVHTGIGKGRLENITDMQNALWLYKELENTQSLSRSLSDAELDELGRTITKANNTRILDSRKRTQFVLQTADNFFQQKGLVSKTDINYFTKLNDILFFAINNTRLAGTEKYIRFTPAISYLDRYTTPNGAFSKYQRSGDSKSILLSAGINKYIPLSLKHQNNFGAAVKLNHIFYRSIDKYFTSGVLTSETKESPFIKQAGVNLFFQHAFYPNTRTIVSFDLQAETGSQKIEDKSGYYGKANLSASFNYFISYRTRFTCDAGVEYTKNTYEYNTLQSLQLLPDIIRFYVNAGVGISL
jgi:hypothetical protein